MMNETNIMLDTPEVPYEDRICVQDHKCKIPNKSMEEFIKQMTAKELPETVSKFRRTYLAKMFPFELDHSGQINHFRLAWKSEIQNQNLQSLIPKLIEGINDSDDRISQIAYQACEEVIQHGKSSALRRAIPFCVLDIKKLMATKNNKIIFRMLRIIEFWIITVEGSAREFAPFIHQIFHFLWSKIHAPHASNKFTTWEKRSLSDYALDVVAQLELRAGDRVYEAYQNIKLAIPTYESQLFSDVSTAHI